MAFLIGHLIIAIAILLNIVSLTLVFTSYLSPFPERHRALITISPNMTAEQYLASGNDSVYAPTVIIGLFGANSDTAPFAKIDPSQVLVCGPTVMHSTTAPASKGGITVCFSDILPKWA
jgi:hypothetical protein